MIETILAQTQPQLPDMAWWQEYGVLGVIAMIVAGAICTALWFLYFPHARASQQQALAHRHRKQELEMQREQKLNGFIDLLAESHSAEVEFKRQIASAVTDIAKTQRSHSEVCERTEERISGLAEKLHQMHPRHV